MTPEKMNTNPIALDELMPELVKSLRKAYKLVKGKPCQIRYVHPYTFQVVPASNHKYMFWWGYCHIVRWDGSVTFATGETAIL